jgi:hypothetical protein
MMRNYRVVYSESVMRLDVGRDHTIKVVMVEPVASITLKNIVAGRLYVFMFQQSSVTPTTIFYCPQMLNKSTINLRRGTLTVQTFVGLNSSQMAAAMAASYAPAS